MICVGVLWSAWVVEWLHGNGDCSYRVGGGFRRGWLRPRVGCQEEQGEVALMRAMTLRLPDEVHEALRREAYESRRSMNELMLDALKWRQVPDGEWVNEGACSVCGKPATYRTGMPEPKWCDAHGPYGEGSK